MSDADPQRTIPIFSSADVCANSGATYRQLDYWVRQGLVTPTIPARGAGTQRAFDLEALVLVTLAMRVVERGMPGPAAVALARQLLGVA